MAKNRVILHLGSNMGDRKDILRRAISLIEEKVGRIEIQSSFYETEAWGMEDQDPFINQVLIASTRLRPLPCLDALQEIELIMGRERHEKWGPRSIDVDLLFYEELIIHVPNLTLPHPGIPYRNFVLAPMAEVAGELIHPVVEKDILTLLDISADQKKVVRLNES